MQNGITDSLLCTRAPRACQNKILGNILMLVLIVAVTSLFGCAANADELSLLVNGKAIHINPAKKNLNESNWGAGVEYSWSRPNQKWAPFATASGTRY